MGCSIHSVPSLSKVAMRSGAGTKSAEPSPVTAATKSRMARLAPPSFHDGSGSAACAWAIVRQGLACSTGSAASVDRTKRRVTREGFIVPSGMWSEAAMWHAG